jgi:hypothetical protein
MEREIYCPEDPDSSIVWGGGAVFITNASSPVFANCVFERNYGQEGSAIYASWGSSAVFENTVFRANTSNAGSGTIHARYFCDLVIRDCTFEDNVQGLAGGGVMLAFECDALIERSTFRNNSTPNLAFGMGGAIYTMYSRTTIRDCHFEDNTSLWRGGAIQAVGTYASFWGEDYLYVSYATIERCTFVNNWGRLRGGAIVLQRGAIRDCTFDGNHSFQGGALWGLPDTEDLLGGVTEAVGCTFRENRAQSSRGGAVMVQGKMLFAAGNEALRGGAVVLGTLPGDPEGIQFPDLTFSDCLFDANDGNEGGAIYAGDDNVIGKFERCTFVRNTSPLGSAIRLRSEAGSQAYVSFESCILDGNVGSAAVSVDEDDYAVFSCSDIFGHPDGDWTGSIAGQLGVNGNFSVDPLFCLLRNPEEPWSLKDSSPCLPGQHPAGGDCGRIGAFDAGCSLVAVGDGGTPPVAALLKALPSPFRTSVDFVLATAAAMPGEVRVLDVTGRVLRNLPIAAAATSVRWDGTDGRGQAVPAGVYFIEARRAQSVLHERVLRLP